MDDDAGGGLRERKKAATRAALSAAALRLARERGPGNVRVDDIAAAAGVSPRTYNNYFASREQAIVAAVTAERALRIAAAVRARPATDPLDVAVIEAVVSQYAADGEPLALITSAPRLRAEYVEAAGALDRPLAAAIAHRTGNGDSLRPAVLAAAVSAAARVAIDQWTRPDDDRPHSPLVVPRGRLDDLLRAALAYVAPALRAADSSASSTAAVAGGSGGSP